MNQTFSKAPTALLQHDGHRRDATGPSPACDEDDGDGPFFPKMNVAGEWVHILRSKPLFIPPSAHVDGHHVALERSRKGVRDLRRRTFGHRTLRDPVYVPRHPCILKRFVGVMRQREVFGDWASALAPYKLVCRILT
jgi:hypothetical protein